MEMVERSYGDSQVEGGGCVMVWLRGTCEEHEGLHHDNTGTSTKDWLPSKGWRWTLSNTPQ